MGRIRMVPLNRRETVAFVGRVRMVPLNREPVTFVGRVRMVYTTKQRDSSLCGQSKNGIYN